MIGEVAQSQTLPVQVNRLGMGALAENRSLTRKEAAVLTNLMDPTQADLTNAQRAKNAGVSERHWYQVIADPWVKQQQRLAVQELVCTSVAPMLKQSIKVATTSNRDGFNDRKLLLSMGGFYVERQQIDHTTAGQPIVGVVGVDPSSL